MVARNVERNTVEAFGDQWARFDQSSLSADHVTMFERYFGIFPWASLPAHATGFDLGCGSGRWARLVAPRVGTLHCIDPSEAALDVAGRNLREHGNCVLHKASVDQMRELESSGKLKILTPYEVRELEADGACVGSAVLYRNDTNEEVRIGVDSVIALLGFKPDLGPVGNWGLELERNSIKVSPLMETNLPGVYAAGDVTHYQGKLELIATGYGEAAVAVNNAVHFLNPKARVNPGHSTNLKVFAQDE